MRYVIGTLLILNLYFDGLFGKVFGVMACAAIMARFGIDKIFCCIFAVELFLHQVAFKYYKMPPEMNEIFGMGGGILFGSSLVLTIAVRLYLRSRAKAVATNEREEAVSYSC